MPITCKRYANFVYINQINVYIDTVFFGWLTSDFGFRPCVWFVIGSECACYLTNLLHYIGFLLAYKQSHDKSRLPYFKFYSKVKHSAI